MDLDLDLDLAGRGVGSKFNGYQVLMLIGVILDSSSASGRSFYLHCRKLEVADPNDKSCSTEDELLPGIQIARRADHVVPITGSGTLAVGQSILTFEFKF